MPRKVHGAGRHFRWKEWSQKEGLDPISPPSPAQKDDTFGHVLLCSYEASKLNRSVSIGRFLKIEMGHHKHPVPKASQLPDVGGGIFPAK